MKATQLHAHVAKVSSAILQSNAKRATSYLTPTLTVKATRQRQPKGYQRAITFLVTVGKPNHRERLFIRACQKAKEPFPVRKIQIQVFPKKRATRRRRR